MTPYNIEKAVQRIGWRMKQGHWNFNENDVTAFNLIVDYVEGHQKKLFDQHEMFAKLYIHIYGHYLMKYMATPYDKIPRQVLSGELMKSVEDHIKEFHRITNDTLQIKQLEKLKNPSDINNFKIDTFDYDFVFDSIVKQVNEVILKHQSWKN